MKVLYTSSFQCSLMLSGTFCLIKSGASAARSASCLWVFFSVLTSSTTKHWIWGICSSLKAESHLLNRSNIFLCSTNEPPPLLLLFTVFFPLLTLLSGPFTCGMSTLYPLLWVQSLWPSLFIPTVVSLFASPSVQLSCAQFQWTLDSFALCPFGLQLFPPLLPFLFGQLGLAETWAAINRKFEVQTYNRWAYGHLTRILEQVAYTIHNCAQVCLCHSVNTPPNC